MRVGQHKKVVQKVGKNRTFSNCRQQFANMFANCLCHFHRIQIELANFGLSYEGNFLYCNLYNDALYIVLTDHVCCSYC